MSHDACERHQTRTSYTVHPSLPTLHPNPYPHSGPHCRNVMAELQDAGITYHFAHRHCRGRKGEELSARRLGGVNDSNKWGVGYEEVFSDCSVGLPRAIEQVLNVFTKIHLRKTPYLLISHLPHYASFTSLSLGTESFPLSPSAGLWAGSFKVLRIRRWYDRV